jgi:serine protease inhibitor
VQACFYRGSLLTCSGKWLTPFDPSFTEADTFHLDKYRAIKVPMMYREGNFTSTFDKKFRCHILKLPYQGNATMLVVLMEKTGDYLALEDYLTVDLVETWLQNMKTRYDASPTVQTWLAVLINTPNPFYLKCPMLAAHDLQ